MVSKNDRLAPQIGILKSLPLSPRFQPASPRPSAPVIKTRPSGLPARREWFASGLGTRFISEVMEELLDLAEVH